MAGPVLVPDRYFREINSASKRELMDALWDVTRQAMRGENDEQVALEISSRIAKARRGREQATR